MEMDSSSEEEDYVLEQNPLLIYTILERLMDLVPLKDVKNCRMVCRKWNYLAEPVLKKRGKIVFTTFSRPSEFMAQFSQPHHLAQPFTAFSMVAGLTYNEEHRLFKDVWPKKNDHRWTLFEVYEFFIKWGKYIKKLELSLNQVWLNLNNNIQELNIDNLLESIGSKLEDLVLVGRIGGEINVEVSLNKLSSVKNICLDGCTINLDSFENRIAPSKLKLKDVFFCRNGKNVPENIINDLVDFSRCSDFTIQMEKGNGYLTGGGAWRSIISFDFSRDFVNSNQIEFQNIILINVEKSKTKTDRLSLCRCQTKAVEIQPKELELRNCKIDLTLIPAITEKLTMKQCKVVSLDIQPLDLPKLKFLSLTPCEETRSDSSIYKIVPLFRNCENLFDLELTRPACNDDDVEWELDLNFLPKSVKVLKFGNYHGLKFVGSNDPIEVDVLFLVEDYEGEVDSESSSSMKKVLKRIKTKVLIRAVFYHESCVRDEPKETVSQFLAKIVQDKKLEKTIVELKHGPHTLRTLEPVDQSKSCKDSADKGSSVFHEFLGQFLVTDEQWRNTWYEGSYANLNGAPTQPYED